MATRDQLVTAGIVGFIIVAAVAATILYFAMHVPSHGNIKAIGIQIFANSAGTQPVESVDWGDVEPGSTSIATLYIKNNGTTPVTLTLTTENYNPAAAEQYLSTTWSYGNQEIQSGQIISVSFQLGVDPNVIDITAFSYDIVVTASG